MNVCMYEIIIFETPVSICAKMAACMNVCMCGVFHCWPIYVTGKTCNPIFHEIPENFTHFLK